MGRSWLPAVRCVVPWLAPAVLSLYIKSHLISLKFMGSVPLPTGSLGTRIWGTLSFFRADLLVGFLIIPALLVVVDYYLPVHLRKAFVVLLAVVTSAVLYCQLRAFEEVGQFLSVHMFSAAIQWGLADPSVISDYVNLRGLLILLGMAATLIAAWRWSARWVTRRKSDTATAHAWYVGTAAAASCLSAITIVAWAYPVPSTSFHESVLVRVVRTFANRPDVETDEFRNLSVHDLTNRYRAMVSAPASKRDFRYWGKAKGCNVLFLVLETAPARVLPADGELDDFPNLRRLRRNSFVGVSHYTTFPQTHQAIFSIFSSWYPSGLVTGLNQHPDLAVPGMMRDLSDLGYDTALYSPFDFRGEPDAAMYDSLGFEREVYPKLDRSILKGFLSSFPVRMKLDTAVLSLLKQDLERTLAQGRRFAYLFAPEVSHGPWLDVEGAPKGHDVISLGRALLSIPDHELGEIIQLLERYDQLRQTVIVVVGDHGIRSRGEDPSFTGGLLGEYTFHVPLLIYAPQAIDHEEKIPWVTSHIDISPTVLGLLGVERERKFELGTPIWNPALGDRTTYFFGESFLGAAGYHSGGKFFMWSNFTHNVYENDALDFEGVTPLRRDSTAYSDVIRSVRRMAGFEEVWLTRFSHANSVRNHFYGAARPVAYSDQSNPALTKCMRHCQSPLN